MLILVLGGARSGKSRIAEQLAHRLPQPVTYLATLAPEGGDEALARRIAAHRSRRPDSWKTVDATADVAEQLRTLPGTVLVDSLGPWVALHRPGAAALDALCTALASRPADTLVVSDEVGLSVHPTTDAGLAFRDALGDVNAAVASVADHTLLVVAGRVVTTAAFDPDALLLGDA